MTNSLFLSTALAGGLMLAAPVPSANAAPSAPALAPNAAQSGLVEKAAWSCGPRRCVWVPGFAGPVPDYAFGWGPPASPDCYWRRGPLGNWKHKCN